MYLPSLIVMALSATALALPADIDKRVGHTGWVASYAPSDVNCTGKYLSSAGNDRPSLTFNQASGTGTSRQFNPLSDNIGIYCGSGSNAFTHVDFFNGHKLVVTIECQHHGFPGTCISMSAMNGPYTAVSVQKEDILLHASG